MESFQISINAHEQKKKNRINIKREGKYVSRADQRRKISGCREPTLSVKPDDLIDCFPQPARRTAIISTPNLTSTAF